MDYLRTSITAKLICFLISLAEYFCFILFLFSHRQCRRVETVVSCSIFCVCLMFIYLMTFTDERHIYATETFYCQALVSAFLCD